MAKTRNARGALKLLSPEPDSATLSCDKNFGQRPHAVPVGHYAFLLGQAPWSRRRGRDIKKCREASLMERTGGEAASPIGRSNQQVLVQLPINRQLDRTAPSAPLRRLRIFFLLAQPPRLDQGGEYALQTVPLRQVCLPK